MKNIIESLDTPEAKQKWRELVKKYHTDLNHGTEETIKRINVAKDNGDEAINDLYDELINGKKRKEQKQQYDNNAGFDDFAKNFWDAFWKNEKSRKQNYEYERKNKDYEEEWKKRERAEQDQREKRRKEKEEQKEREYQERKRQEEEENKRREAKEKEEEYKRKESRKNFKTWVETSEVKTLVKNEKINLSLLENSIKLSSPSGNGLYVFFASSVEDLLLKIKSFAAIDRDRTLKYKLFSEYIESMEFDNFCKKNGLKPSITKVTNEYEDIERFKEQNLSHISIKDLRNRKIFTINLDRLKTKEDLLEKIKERLVMTQPFNDSRRQEIIDIHNEYVREILKTEKFYAFAQKYKLTYMVQDLKTTLNLKAIQRNIEGNTTKITEYVVNEIEKKTSDAVLRELYTKIMAKK